MLLKKCTTFYSHTHNIVCDVHTACTDVIVVAHTAFTFTLLCTFILCSIVNLPSTQSLEDTAEQTQSR